MKITRKSLREMIWEQLASESVFEIADTVNEVKGEDIMDPTSELQDQFETVDEHTVLQEAQQKIEEIRTISEEMKRMKQLVDFRSPLLSKKDS
jgi:hypothetical protein